MLDIGIRRDAFVLSAGFSLFQLLYHLPALPPAQLPASPHLASRIAPLCHTAPLVLPVRVGVSWTHNTGVLTSQITADRFLRGATESLERSDSPGYNPADRAFLTPSHTLLRQPCLGISSTWLWLTPQQQSFLHTSLRLVTIR